MTLRALVIVIGVAGCDNLFGLRHIEPGTPPIDSQLVDGRATDGPGHDDGNPLDAVVDVGCPSTYAIAGNNSFYRFVNTGATWLAAEADCADDTTANNSKHTHLAVVGDDQELTYLYVTVSGSAGDLWIGFSDRVAEYTYLWVTAEPNAYGLATGAPWGRGQPSKLPGEDCILEHAGTTELDDVDCTTVAKYVCECDDFPDVPGRY